MSEKSLIEKHFSKELKQIKSMTLSNIVRTALENVSDDFWKMSASSSGVNHPKTSNGCGGQITHIKSAFWIAHTLCGVAPVSERTKDLILSAILLHDIEKKSHNIDSHAKCGAIAVEKIMHDMHNRKVLSFDFPMDQRKSLLRLVENHMGHYGDNYNPGNIDEFIVHAADMIASRKWCEFNAKEIGNF